MDYYLKRTENPLILKDLKRQGLEVKKGKEITCRCKKTFPIQDMYRCLYCGVYFCLDCAEKHFGRTREEYDKINHTKS